MARIRSIHPDACKSEKLAQVSGDAERCYWRLQTHADDEGRCEDHPRLIWAALFPLHEEIGPTDVIGWLDELEEAGLIVRYEVGAVRYLSVTQWGRFQHPQRPKPSLFPEPSANGTGQVRDASATCIARRGEGVGEGDVEGEGDGLAVATRPRDELFEAVVSCWKINTHELTETERGRLNKGIKLLRDVNACPEHVALRRRVYRQKYPDAADSLLAIAGHWSELGQLDDGRPPTLPKGTDATMRGVAAIERGESISDI